MKENRGLIYLTIGFVAIVAVLVGTSYMNMQKYFIVARHGAVEIWKGTFSPMGRERLIIMPGGMPPDPMKEVYSREEVAPLAFRYYVEKSDALMDVPGLPDFSGIRSDLDRALSYATTEAQRTEARLRINKIDRLILLYKADVAAGRGTPSGLETAAAYLQEAAKLHPDDIEAKLIDEKLATIQMQIRELSPQPQTEPSPSPAQAPVAPAPETPPPAPDVSEKEKTL
jgi:hypothetical protein